MTVTELRLRLTSEDYTAWRAHDDVRSAVTRLHDAARRHAR